MAIYQFLIAVRSQNGAGGTAVMLTNADGETTSHVQGLFNRTIRFLTEGIRPVYVFDGKPPQIKSGELQKRRDRRDKAQAALKTAQDDGNVEEQDKQSRRLVRAGQKENDDCKKLLQLMGIPILTAPCEAEAQASFLAKSGLVYATATEDMDALTFQTPVLLRKMTFANNSKALIQTMNYEKAVAGLGLNHDQFIDLCILLGCDYCDNIKGIGPKTALKLVLEHQSIENILKHIDQDKYAVPEDWLPNEARKKAKVDDYTTDDENEENEENDEQEEVEPIYVSARRLFKHHEVTKDVDLKWKDCNADDLTKFLVDEMGFNLERVKANIEKLQKAYKGMSKPQARMDSFFSVRPSDNGNAKKIADKKKAAALKEKDDKKKKGGHFGKRKR
jgi:flap endonuclease-1